MTAPESSVAVGIFQVTNIKLLLPASTAKLAGQLVITGSMLSAATVCISQKRLYKSMFNYSCLRGGPCFANLQGHATKHLVGVES